MNDHPAEQIGLLLRSGGLVGGSAAVLAVGCWLLLRIRGQSVCPRWTVPPFIWPGPIIFSFYFAYLFVSLVLVPLLNHHGLFDQFLGRRLPSLDTNNPESVLILNQLKSMWTGFVFVPTLLLVAVVIRTTILAAPVRWSAVLRCVPRTLLLGTLIFFSFGVASQALNVFLGYLWHRLGWTMTEHPLSRMGLSGDGTNGVVFALSACVMTPILEEFMFRGLLVPWASGRRYRPWILMGISLFISWGKAQGGVNVPAVAFVLGLAAISVLVHRFGKVWHPRFPVRTWNAVWSSSTLFAAFHSSVWPSPIPLFVLALGLGAVTARTRSWWPAAFAHALFNTVSTVVVGLRG